MRKDQYLDEFASDNIEFEQYAYGDGIPEYQDDEHNDFIAPYNQFVSTKERLLGEYAQDEQTSDYSHVPDYSYAEDIVSGDNMYTMVPDPYASDLETDSVVNNAGS